MTGLHVDRHGADTNEFENVVPGTTDWFTPLEAFDPSLDTHRVITWVIAHDSIPSGADIADVYEYNQNGDQLMTNRVVNLMQDPATDVVMTFFSDVDTAGHTCGFSPTAACYLAEIANTDAQIGQIMIGDGGSAELRQRRLARHPHHRSRRARDGPLRRPSRSSGRYRSSSPARWPRRSCRKPIHASSDVAATVLTYFGAPHSEQLRWPRRRTRAGRPDAGDARPKPGLQWRRRVRPRLRQQLRRNNTRPGGTIPGPAESHR